MAKTKAGVPFNSPDFHKSEHYTTEELVEIARLREKCVDDKGMRTIKIVKGKEEEDNVLLDRLEEKGYVIEDKGRRYTATIPQALFLENEKARVAETIGFRGTSTSNPKKRPSVHDEFVRDEDIELKPASLEALMSGSGLPMADGTPINY